MNLYILQEKLQNLIKAYKILKTREAYLEEKVASLESKVDYLEQNVQQLEEALIVKSIGSINNNDALKTYIDAIINEIDITIKKL